MTKKEKTNNIIKAITPQEDIDLINQYTLERITADEVFTFAVILCDNEVDRDYERFANFTLSELAPLFIGKTGIFDHSWNAKEQVARLYKTEVINGKGRNSLGENLKQLKGYAYINRNAETEELISKIKTGILKEVSVACSVDGQYCSICGANMGWYECENGHQKGKYYDEKLCFAELIGATDAYEFSFVAVPAQKGAGITKSAEQKDVIKAFEILIKADLSKFPEQTEKLKKQIATAGITIEEMTRRKAIADENKVFLNKEENKNNGTL